MTSVRVSASPGGCCRKRRRRRRAAFPWNERAAAGRLFCARDLEGWPQGAPLPDTRQHRCWCGSGFTPRKLSRSQSAPTCRSKAGGPDVGQVGRVAACLTSRAPCHVGQRAANVTYVRGSPVSRRFAGHPSQAPKRSGASRASALLQACRGFTAKFGWLAMDAGAILAVLFGLGVNGPHRLSPVTEPRAQVRRASPPIRGRA